MPIIKKINFIFNYSNNTLQIPLKTLLQYKDNLKTYIQNEASKTLNISLLDMNIILYDIHNEIFINDVQELLENKTKICKIIIKPINY